MNRKLKILLMIPLLFLGGNLWALDENPDALPLLLEAAPPRPYDILSPVGAGKKTVEEARHQLLLEAKKLDAEAVFHVICEEGGISREGLVFQKRDAYCRGIAIRFRTLKNTPNLP